MNNTINKVNCQDYFDTEFGNLYKILLYINTAILSAKFLYMYVQQRKTNKNNKNILDINDKVKKKLSIVSPILKNYLKILKSEEPSRKVTEIAIDINEDEQIIRKSKRDETITKIEKRLAEI